MAEHMHMHMCVYAGSGLSEHARCGKGASEWDLEMLMGDLKVRHALLKQTSEGPSK